MNGMRDPAEVEAEERAKKEAQVLKAAEREAIMQAVWDYYMRFFRFSEVTYLAFFFFKQAFLKGITTVNTPRPLSNPITGGVSIDREGVYQMAKEWLKYRYNCGDTFTVSDDNANQAAVMSGMDAAAQDWTLPAAVAFVYNYQVLFLEQDDNAGFRREDADGFKAHFDSFRGGASLKPVDLWRFLKDLGFEFKTQPEQAIVVEMLKDVAVATEPPSPQPPSPTSPKRRTSNQTNDGSTGELTYSALLHLLRKLIEKEREAPRKREHDLIVQSGMDLVECEGWYAVFSAAASPAGDIRMSDIRELFESIKLKWDVDGSKQLRAWLTEVDEDNNGLIDFGEFCCLVQKMWDQNFGGIRSKASAAFEAATEEQSDGPKDPHVSTWTEMLSKATQAQVKEELEDPSSPTARKLIREFEAILAS